MSEDDLMSCPATREAVWEYEQEHGGIGCPICGSDAVFHPTEEPVSDDCRGAA